MKTLVVDTLLIAFPWMISCLLFYGFVILPVSKFVRTQEWVETEFYMIDSRVGYGRRATERIDVAYSYEYGGEKHVGTTYNILNSSQSFYHEEVPEEIKAGKTVIGYVNPEDPSESILDRSFQYELLVIGLISSFFVLIFSLAMLGGFSEWMRLIGRKLSAQHRSGL